MATAPRRGYTFGMRILLSNDDGITAPGLAALRAVWMLCRPAVTISRDALEEEEEGEGGAAADPPSEQEGDSPGIGSVDATTALGAYRMVALRR